MDTTAAAALVNSLIYKPGWHFDAEDFTARFEGTIRVAIHYPAFNSSNIDDENEFTEEITPHATFPILVGDISDADSDLVLRRLADTIMRIEEHEMREFLRVPETKRAPFHPHTVDGMKTWHKTCTKGDDFFADLNSDLQFGIL